MYNFKPYLGAKEAYKGTKFLVLAAALVMFRCSLGVRIHHTESKLHYASFVTTITQLCANK
jgi:hypothetical protein